MSTIFLLSSLSALLLAVPFVFPVLFPLAWIAFLPLFWLIGKAEDLRRAVFFGWLTGFLTHAVGFYWLVYTISVFGGFSYPISGVLFLVYASLQGLQLAFFALFVRRMGLGPLNVFPALFWVALEFWFPLLFPWYLANSQAAFLSFIQSADLVGPYGASFLIMWFNTSIYAALFHAKQDRRMYWMPAALVVSLVVGSVIYGFSRLAQITAEMSSAPKLVVAAIQGNIDVDLKWNPERMNSNLKAYLTLTHQADGVPLIIWPETAVEAWVPENLQQLPLEYMPQLGSDSSFFIFGARSFRGKPGGPNFKMFNTAFLTDAQGRVLDRYHKQVLLAFGEYLPFTAILSKLPAMPFSDGFTPGDGPHTLDVPGGSRIAPLICYEDLMPELSRRFVKVAKANILVNLTNDAWYGRSVAPWQHARLAQWRAIETRRSLLRATNTGVTALINAKGEIGEALPIFTPAVLTTQVDVLEGETFYVRFGDWFAWSVTLISIGVILFLWRRPERSV